MKNLKHRLEEINVYSDTEFKQEFSVLEKKGIDVAINDWLEDDQGYQFFDLDYKEDKYAKFQYNWKENEGFNIEKEEYFDHLAVHNDGSIVIVTIKDINLISGRGKEAVEKRHTFYKLDI